MGRDIGGRNRKERVTSVKGILEHQNIFVEDCREVERINACVEDIWRRDG